MNIDIKAFEFEHKGNKFYLCLMTADVLAEISYVARRGIDEEKGAVQRILNKSRISGIKDFLLNNGFFPTNIILNIIGSEKISYNEKSQTLTLEKSPRIAQVIDGQHRIEGLKEAIKVDKAIHNMCIPTVLANNLTTESCAEIFVSINTEQKSVPKSLIYDLYGLMDISAKDFSIERGTDIAKILNTEDTSPYQGYIKFPGSRKFKGGIQLSTFVNSLKVLVKSDGEFSKYSITTLETQASVLKNYFNAIQSYYGELWDSLQNPFLFAAGFTASIDVFVNKILPICFANKKFKEEYLKELIIIPKDKLLKQTEVKGLSGESAIITIKNRLLTYLQMEDTSEDDFEI